MRPSGFSDAAFRLTFTPGASRHSSVERSAYLEPEEWAKMQVVATMVVAGLIIE